MGKIESLIAGVALPVKKQREAANLAAEFAELESEVKILNLENQNLRAEVNPLKREVAQLKEKIIQLDTPDKLVFDQRTGTYADKSGVRYCIKCEFKGKRAPIRNEEHGWRCMVCDNYYSDPLRPEPNPNVSMWSPTDPGMGL